jgi:SAM-dependent methyltransferase
MKIQLMSTQQESLKPIPVSSPLDNPILFKIRCLLDLQLSTIVSFLKPNLSRVKGTLLDVGAGNSPWKCYLSKEVKYVGLDIDTAQDFNMKSSNEIIYYPGGSFPFGENKFDTVLCVEVLEHVYESSFFLAEIHRCLISSGELILTVPWSARRHHLPDDYFRYTPEAIVKKLDKIGFVNIIVTERGNDFAVVFNKLLCIILGLIFPKNRAFLFFTLLLIIFILPYFILFFILAHATMLLGIGSNIDPLGYAVTAIKP